MTTALKNSFGSINRREVPMFRAVCRNLHVGKAFSTSCSPIMLYKDRLEYTFYHQSGPVKMLMRFRDIDDASLSMSSLIFRFHVCQPLNHFASEYSQSRPDFLSFQFCSRKDAYLFKTILPNLEVSANFCREGQ
jgi:hypothetical protein